MKKLLVLTVASCALLDLVPNAHAGQPARAKHRTARIAWCAADTEAHPRLSAAAPQPERSTKTDEAGRLFRSFAERTMVNPG